MPAKRILIADDDADLSRILASRCKHLGLEVFRSPDALHALLGSHRVEPDLILLDVNMPSGNGLSVCEMLAGDRKLAMIPVIIMTGASDESIARRATELGAVLVKKGSGLWDKLEPIICATLDIEPEPPQTPAPIEEVESSAPPVVPGRPKVLCADDDPDISKIIKLRLEPLGVDVVRAFSGMQAYWCCLDSRPDVVITDLNMPDGEGNYLFYRLKQHPLTQNLPVIVLTGANNPALKRQLTSLGVAEYLAKPLVFPELLALLNRYITLPSSGESPLASGFSAFRC